jgi:hypothetical protein
VELSFDPTSTTPVSIVAADRLGVYRLWNATTGTLLGGSGDTTESVLRIGHSVAALFMAYLGGHLSRWLFATGPAAQWNDRWAIVKVPAASLAVSHRKTCLDQLTYADLPIFKIVNFSKYSVDTARQTDPQCRAIA